MLALRPPELSFRSSWDNIRGGIILSGSCNLFGVCYHLGRASYLSPSSRYWHGRQSHDCPYFRCGEFSCIYSRGSSDELADVRGIWPFRVRRNLVRPRPYLLMQIIQRIFRKHHSLDDGRYQVAAAIGFRIYSCSPFSFWYLLVSWYVKSANSLPG